MLCLVRPSWEYFSMLDRYHLRTQITVDENSNWCWEYGKERAWLMSRDVLQLNFYKLLSLLHKQIHTTKQLQATNCIILHDLLSGFLPGRKWLGQILYFHSWPPSNPTEEEKTQKNKPKTQPKSMGSNTLCRKMCLSVVKLHIACWKV